MDSTTLYDPDDECTIAEQIVCSTHPYPGWVRYERAQNGDYSPPVLPVQDNPAIPREYLPRVWIKPYL